MPKLQNFYWEKINWRINVLYIIAGLWTLNYTRSAASARPLFALLVVVYPTYFCRILCLLGVLTRRYRTPVYFQRAVLFLLTGTHPHVRVLPRSRTDALEGVTTGMKMGKWLERPKTFARALDVLVGAHPRDWFQLEREFNASRHNLGFQIFYNYTQNFWNSYTYYPKY